jgi:hypothetical protein
VAEEEEAGDRGSRRVDGGKEEVAKLLEWSGKDGVETLRIFLLYGRLLYIIPHLARSRLGRYSSRDIPARVQAKSGEAGRAIHRLPGKDEQCRHANFRVECILCDIHGESRPPALDQCPVTFR